MAATLAAVLVKEDACLPIFAASVGLALNRYRSMTWADRCLFLVLPTVVAVANLVLFYGWVLPFLTGESRPSYAHFWGNYGETPARALLSMLAQPWRVLSDIMTSGVFRTLSPHLLLPLVAWRWSLGTLPIIALYGTSANDQVRAFGIYYAILLVPSFVIAASNGALTLTRKLTANAGHAQLAAAAAILLGPLLVGSGHRGYSLRPWKPEIAAVPQALARLDDERLVLVQSGLFPHAGYDERFQLLTPETLLDPRNAGGALLLARNVDAYPYRAMDLRELLKLAPINSMPDHLVAVRIPETSALGERLQRRGPFPRRRYRPWFR